MLLVVAFRFPADDVPTNHILVLRTRETFTLS